MSDVRQAKLRITPAAGGPPVQRAVHGALRLSDSAFTALTFLAVCVAFLFLLLPICVSTMMAFDSRTYLGPLPPQGFSLQWFERLFSDPYYIDGFKTSLAVSGVAILVSTIAGVSTAVFLNARKFPGSDAVAAFIVSPLIVPPVVIGFALLLFLARMGVISGFPRLICGHVILTFPYLVRATLAGLVGIDRSYTEVALSLGATERQAFREIVFPLARTGIIAGMVFGLAVSFDDVSVSMFLTDPTTYTLPVALISQMRASFDLTIAAVATILVAFTVIVIVVLDRLIGLNRVIGQGIYK
jgi:putative spermidine/putrescine transport system permease protein